MYFKIEHSSILTNRQRIPLPRTMPFLPLLVFVRERFSFKNRAVDRPILLKTKTKVVDFYFGSNQMERLLLRVTGWLQQLLHSRQTTEAVVNTDLPKRSN